MIGRENGLVIIETKNPDLREEFTPIKNEQTTTMQISMKDIKTELMKYDDERIRVEIYYDKLISSIEAKEIAINLIKENNPYYTKVRGRKR